MSELLNVKWPDPSKKIRMPEPVEINDRFTPVKGKPKITKNGAVGPNGESTPFVWQGRYMRLELQDPTNGLDIRNPEVCAIIRDVATGEEVGSTGYGCYYHAGYLEGDTFYVTASVIGWENGYESDTIKIFSTKDLVHWEERILFTIPGFRFFNTSLTKSEEGYVLAVEINKPFEWAGPKPFTCIFLTSKDMQTWELLPKEYTYPKDRYCGGPYLTYDDGYYYFFLVTELPCQQYTTYAVRSKDLLQWEVGRYNPLLIHDEEDRKIASHAVRLSDEMREKIPNSYSCNASDLDLCEFEGKTMLSYNAGNQLGFYYMVEAVYDGPKSEFLKRLFE